MRKFVGKLIGLMLVGTLVVSSFTGCAKKDNKAEGQVTNAGTEQTENKESKQNMDQEDNGNEFEVIDASGDGEVEEIENVGAVLMGGWNIGIASGMALPEEVQARFDKALSNYTGMSFEPITLLGSQVVAGMNYAILCKGTPVVPNAVPALKVVIIYADLSGGATITSVNDFNVADYNTGDTSAASAEIIPGGWGTYTEEACELPEGANEAFKLATEGLLGATYQPLAVVANQIVAGMNYAYICKVTPVVPDAVGSLNVVIVYKDLGGGARITTVKPLNIGDYNK